MARHRYGRVSPGLDATAGPGSGSPLATGPDDATITSWAVAAKGSDRTAAASFVRATQQQVHRIHANVVSPGDAGNLTRETYLRAMRGLPRFAARTSVRIWLYTIARRVATDHLQAAAARPRLVGPQRQVTQGSLLAGLAPPRRLALVATQVLGLSYAEAAEVCDCPTGVVRSRVACARDDLVAALRHRSHGRFAPQ